MSRGRVAYPLLVGLGVLLLVLIAVGPALWLKDYCSKTEIEGYPTAYHVTEHSYTEMGGTQDGGNKSASDFSFGEIGPGKPSQIDRSQTTDYAAPEPYGFWRRFVCDINGADYTLALFTIILALSTIGLWVVTVMSLWHARADSERQARDTQDSFKLARQGYVATHRPKIVLRHIAIKEIGDKISLRLWFVNQGATEATIQHFNGGWGTKRVTEGGMSVGFTTPPGLERTAMSIPGDDGNGRVSNGGGFNVMLTDRIPIPKDTLAAVNALRQRLYVTGYVRYDDDNGTTRQMGFIRWYDSQFDSFQRVPAEWAHSDLEYDE